MTSTEFRLGEKVYWWRRVSRVEYPHPAEILAVTRSRVTVSVDDCGRGLVIRHVQPASLQRIEVYYVKADNQLREIPTPTRSWCRFTRNLEIGEDLRALRLVDEFANGNLLSYDRTHWQDSFGGLCDGRSNRNRKTGPWGTSEEIGREDFERLWRKARNSALWQQQQAALLPIELGAPPWLKVRGWRPPPLTRPN